MTALDRIQQVWFWESYTHTTDEVTRPAEEVGTLLPKHVPFFYRRSSAIIDEVTDLLAFADDKEAIIYMQMATFLLGGQTNYIFPKGDQPRALFTAMANGEHLVAGSIMAVPATP